MGSLAESRLLNALRQVDEVTRGRPTVGLSHDDADEVEGTIACDDAVGFDPLPLLRSLDEHGAQVVIIGQVAGILNGSTELTGDLDLLWSGRPADAPAISAGFGAVNALLTDDDGRRLPSGTEAFGLPKVQFRTSTSAGDCCTPALPWGQLDIDGFIDRAESTLVDGIRIRYVSRSDLIAMRLAVGRPKDLRRAAELQCLDHDQHRRRHLP
jgi:hypothetical protein